MYDDLPETQPIQVADGFVTFTKHFKYLGSYISYNLRDDYDIQNRVLNASKAMGALKNFWDNPHVDLYSKFLIFRAIPLNLLLWGCETWSMRKQLIDDFGTLKDWINEANDELYWEKLIKCMLHPEEQLPDRPTTWRRRSARNRRSEPQQA